MHTLPSLLFALAFAGLVSSCQPEVHGKLSEKHELWLNQSLLSESTQLLSRLWATKVELEPEVSRIKDLSVDCAPGKAVSLEEALDYIVGYVARHHDVQLKWAVEGDRVVISKQ